MADYYAEVVNDEVPNLIITTYKYDDTWLEVTNPEDLINLTQDTHYAVMEVNAQGTIDVVVSPRVSMNLSATPVTVPADGGTVMKIATFPALVNGEGIPVLIDGPVATQDTRVIDGFLDLTFTVPGEYTIKTLLYGTYLQEELIVNVTT